MAHIKDVKIGSNTYLIEPTVYAATAGDASAITAAVTNFALDTGVVVNLKITAANAANATLNVNGTGAKAIRYNNANIAADALKVNRFYSLLYDGSYWQLLGELDTNTWRGIQDNLTSSTNTTESLSAKQGYLLANGSARDDTKVSKSGDIMTGHLVAPSIRIANTYYGITFGRTTATSVETILHTGIKWVNDRHMPVIHITGYAYGLQSPVEFKIGFYIYSDKIGYCGVTNMGAWQPNVFLFKDTRDDYDYVGIGLAGSCYFLQLQADLQDEMGKFNYIDTDSSKWSWTFSTTTGVIPAEDEGTTCIQVPYKANILNPSKVNGHTVEVDVPSNAKFTDTTTLTSMTGTLAIDHGGTGATTAAGARTNLGLGSMATATETNYVKVDGTRAMTGSLSISKAGECGVEVNNTQSTNPNQVAFIVGSSGNGGIYSRKHTKWIVYADASGNVVLNGNANTAGAFSSAKSIALTGDVTGSASSTGGWSITTTIGSGKVTNAMLAGSIANGKLANSKVTIAGQDVSLGGSLAASTLTTALGLSSAMKYKGSLSSLPTATDAATYSTYSSGDVVTISSGGKEYVYNKGDSAANSSWVELGDESSYKIKQTAVSDPTAAATTSTTFIDTISQNTNGVISATKKTLPTASSTVAGITKVGASGGAAAYDHTHAYVPYATGANDLNTIYDTGFYNITSGSMTNGPTNYGYGNLIVLDYRKHSGNTKPDFAGQIYLHQGSQATNGNTLYYRSSTGNTWSTWQMVAHTDSAAAKGSANTPIYVTSTGVITEGTTYAGGTAVTLNNASKAGSTASFYAPTTGGTADTEALVGNGATSAPKWVDINPSITIGAGTASATPTINVTVLGQSGTAASLTTASTSVYGATKLQDGVSSTSTALAATANAAYTASRSSLHTLGTTTKYYVTGVSGASTNTAGDYFDTGIYSTTVAGELSAVRHSFNVSGTETAYMYYNLTDDSIDFMFV